MSKYFTDETVVSDLTTQLPPKEENFTMPTPQVVNQQEIPIAETIPLTEPKTVEEHIAKINHENKEINKAVKQITETTQEEITNTFETFTALELFEKMNQITYLLIKMNNRMTSIEEVLAGKADAEILNKTEKKLTPREQFMQEEQQKNEDNLDKANSQLKKGMSEEVIGLPDEDYLDKGTNLESMFPNMPSEAYQAAYQALDKTEAPKNVSKSPNGGTTGIVF